MVTADEVHAALRRARSLLRERGVRVDVSARDFLRWLHTETPYPNPSFDEVVGNRFYMIHEVVEVNEMKRRGFRITKDVIVKNMQAVNDAHLTAAAAEFRVAAESGAADHLRRRYEDLKSWCADPLLTPAQKRRYESFRRAAQGLLDRTARTVRPSKPTRRRVHGPRSTGGGSRG